MRKIAIVALLSAFIATPALADNTGNFYVAGDLGTATYSNVNDGLGNNFPNPMVLRIAGGYHFSPQLAAEVGYSIFGDSVIDYGNLGLGAGKATMALRSFQVVAVGSLPLSPQFDLIGKLGLARNSGTLTGTGILAGVNASTSQSDLLIGLGAQYHVTSSVSVRALYDNYGKFDSSSNPTKATSFSLGGVYNF